MSANRNNQNVAFGEAFYPLFTPCRYKVYYGGRGGAKSWAFARALLFMGMQKPMRILCARELQVSIADSVHKLLCDQIEDMGMGGFYRFTKTNIYGCNGTEFIFKGVRHNANEIKSLEGVDVCWVEEAQSVSKESWDLLIPTIRKENSEIWISFNPGAPDDETYVRFVKNPPENAIVKKVGWKDNPWFPDTLKAEMEYCLRVSPDDYAHIWGGEPSILTEAQIFKGRFLVEPFETPQDVRFFHGADWGFANDPTCLVRCFIKGDRLFIDREAYGVGVELDETPQLFDSIETARSWPIKADSARPETISFMRRRGFNVTAAQKWSGSVEDGLAVLKSFEKIIIHPKCIHAADEFRLYSYKTDKNNGDILPIIVDANNHCIAEGMLIYTDRGEIPIEKVTESDKVLTRKGYRKVLFCGITGSIKPCVDIYTNHSFLRCTPDHKVFTLNKGFIEAQNLENGDLLLCVANDRLKLNMKGPYGEGIQIPKGEVTGFIIKKHKKKEVLSGYTVTSGKKNTGKYLKVMSYIISMAIQKITTLKILNVYQLKNTEENIHSRQKNTKGNANISIRYGIKQKNGTGQKKDEPSIKKLGQWLIRILNQKKKYARIAGNNSCQKHLATEIYSVLTPVSQIGEENKVSMKLNVYASGAERNSCIANTKSPQLVVVPVKTILFGKTAKKVYDISVEGQHEFFANGVLVHNCIDALRYSLDGYIHGKGEMKFAHDTVSRLRRRLR